MSSEFKLGGEDPEEPSQSSQGYVGGFSGLGNWVNQSAICRKGTYR